MKMIDYYKYINRWFFRRVRNKELAEDYTQDFMLYCWENRHKLGQHIGMSFIHKAVGYFYGHIAEASRTQRRNGEMIPLDALLSEPSYPAPYEERIYSQQLYSLVDRINKPKLKAAILFFLNMGQLSKEHARYWEMIKYNKLYLNQMVGENFA